MLQAYLRRTYADIRAQIRRGSTLRLVKGAFPAGGQIAFTSWAEVKASSPRLTDLMFSRTARDAGFYPILATHDRQLQAYAVERL